MLACLSFDKVLLRSAQALGYSQETHSYGFRKSTDGERGELQSKRHFVKPSSHKKVEIYSVPFNRRHTCLSHPVE
jgi:hypothetical protein